MLDQTKSFGFVVPDDPKMYADIFVSSSELSGAEDGDKVLAELTDWPSNSKNPFGKITKVLGKPGDHDTEIHAILAEFGLPYSFPDAVEQDAANVDTEITKEEMYQMNSNVFSISEKVIVSEENFTRLNTWLRKNGFRVEEIPFAEISKQEGLLRCSTLPLIRD